jgi:hypothetical protein
MQWFIWAIGVLALLAGVFQFRKAIGFRRMLAEMNMDKTRTSIILWLIRVGGFLSILLGLWMLLFLKV